MYQPLTGQDFSNDRLRDCASFSNGHGKPRPGTADVIICPRSDQCAARGKIPINV
jgi:hypothetical protein